MIDYIVSKYLISSTLKFYTRGGGGFSSILLFILLSALCVGMIEICSGCVGVITCFHVLENFPHRFHFLKIIFIFILFIHLRLLNIKTISLLSAISIEFTSLLTTTTVVLVLLVV